MSLNRKAASGAFARCVGEGAQRERSGDVGTEPEHEGEEAERSGFPAEGQARIRGGRRAAVLQSEAVGQRGAEWKRKPPLSGRGAKPVSDDSGRRNGAKWKRQPVERFNGGAAMERSGDGLNRRSQAPRGSASLGRFEA